LGNALTKVRIDQGRPHIDGEFSLALAQALGVTGAMWVGAREYRQLSDLARQGRTEFSTEVQNFEIKPTTPDLGRLGLAGIGVVLLIVTIAFLKGSKRNGY
jgi:ABC-type phosphate transport system permease subunit